LLGQPTGFRRSRLAREKPDGQKYFQACGSGTRAYIPPQFHSLPPGDDLVITEGEFKALSLIDAGIKAIGLPNFNTYARDVAGQARLLDGLREALDYTKPERLLFLGDSDTATNVEFSRNAIFLADSVKPLLVLLPRIPISGPGKGIDDVRQTLGEKFPEFWRNLVESAEGIDLKSSIGALAVRLLERETDGIKASVGAERDKLTRRIVEMATSFRTEPLAQERIVNFAEQVFGISRSAFKATITKDKGNTRRRQVAEDAPAHDAEQTPNQWFMRRFPKLAERHGEPVQESRCDHELPRVADICEDFMAATLGQDGQPNAPTVFLASEERFYTYEPKEGIFHRRSEPDLSAGLSKLFLECARECRDHCDVSRLEFGLRDSAALSGVLRRARSVLQVDDGFFKPDVLESVAVANGVLRLADRTLQPFSPSYRRRNKLTVAFDPAARCPLFLDTLMEAALDDDDVSLVQRWCGLALLGENLAQRILLLTGTAGGGKGALVRVVCGIIGEKNLASLRTGLLAERFELGRYIGRTLLYGADVPDDFLNHKSASVLKALTGGDPVTVELKNSNEVLGFTCRFNVIVTSNSRLTVHLEGDTDAWRRRLAIVRYARPKPANVIPDLSERILREEGSGVLNWMLDGLDQLRADKWQLRLNEPQQRRVDDLLLESDGHREFVRRCLAKESNATLTLNDSFAAYLDFCNDRGWEAISRNRFGRLIPDAVVQEHRVILRRDIKDGAGKEQQGWKGLRLSSSTQWSEKKASEPSAHPGPETGPEASEGFFSHQAAEETYPSKPLLSL
jgi:P4 family phage/plasmid primase-like protien